MASIAITARSVSAASATKANLRPRAPCGTLSSSARSLSIFSPPAAPSLANNATAASRRRRAAMSAMPSGSAGAFPEPGPPAFRADDEPEEQQAQAKSGAARKRSYNKNDPNKGYTWLDHPCPYHPFRYKTDEDAWYVEPNMAERKLAMDMGLPLWCIL